MPNKSNPRLKIFILWISLSLGLAVIDQITKKVALKNLLYLTPVNVFTGFDFTLVYNEGAAFSFLSNAGGWQRWFFAFFALLAIIGLAVYLLNILKKGCNEVLRPIGIALIIGCALGNLIDRILLGHVVDFISVYYKSWFWPAFNFADICISVGVACLLYELIFIRHE